MTSKQTYSVCFCWRRRFKLALAEAPSEIKTLFNEYSENELMTPSHLKRFLVDVQRQEKATEEDAQAIIDSFRHFHRRGAGLNLETFFKYLFSDDNPPLLPSHGVSKKKHSAFCVFLFGFCQRQFGSTRSGFGIVYFPIGCSSFLPRLDFTRFIPLFYFFTVFVCCTFSIGVFGFILLQFLQKLGLLMLVLVYCYAQRVNRNWICSDLASSWFSSLYFWTHPPKKSLSFIAFWLTVKICDSSS